VDADGDGIGDSRWERAPIPLMTGVEYFMAVRIIDASSLMNLASASAITDDGDEYTVPTPPDISEVTGYFPTSLDFTRLLGKRGIDPSADIAGYFTSVRDGLLGTNVPTPFGLTPPNSLTDYPSPASYGDGQIRGWREGVGEAGNLAPFAEATLKLAYRNAWSANPNGTTSEYEDETAGALDAPGDSDNDAPPTEAHWSPDLAVATWDSIRHMVTTITGENVYSRNHDGDTSSAARTRVDLNHGNTQARADDIRDRLEAIYGLGGGYGLSGPDVVGTAAEAAAAFALNIAEYGDANGRPDASINAGGADWYGLEALPFIREAYFQVGYEDKDTSPAAEPSDWEPVNNSHGLVVEIANPFDRPIRLDQPESPQIRMVVIERDTDDIVNGSKFEFPTTWGEIKPLDGPSAGGQPDQHVVAIYSVGSQAFNEGGSGADLENDVIRDATIPAGYQIEAADDNLLGNIPFNTELGVALQVLKPGGNPGVDNDWVTYDRIFAHGGDSTEFPDLIPFGDTSDPGTEPTGIDQAYIQKSLRRDDTGINFLSNRNKDVTAREPDNLTPPVDASSGWPNNGFNGGIGAFGNAGNNVTGEDLSNFQIPMANRHIFSVAELGWIMAFGFNDSDTGDFPQLFSGADGSSGSGIDERDRFLRFDGASNSTNATAVSIDSDDLTYAQLVIDEFTTLHPRHDGLDNDGDGTDDNAEEQFVFGTMNLNTAPRHIAALAASYPGNVSDTAGLIDLIQNDTVRSMGQVVSRIVGGTSPPDPADAEFDLYPMVEAEAEYSAERYQLSFEAEDAMKRAQFFLQGFSNRSDIYIAHIFVAGYVDTDGDDNYDELIESGRMIVVLSRATLQDPDTDEVEVLASFRY